MIDLEQQIRAEKIRTIHNQAAVLVFGSTFCALIVAAFLWHSLPQTGLLIWIGSLSLLSILRYALIMRYRASEEQAQSSLHWGRLFWMGSLVAGILWGLWPMVYYDLYTTELLLLISTIFAGMVAVSAAAGGIYLPAFLSFSVPLVLPLASAHLLSDSDSLQLTGGLLVIFLAINYFLASRTNIRDEALLRAQFRNHDLMDRLHEEKAIAESAVVAKSRFLASASHDLRQPLHAMGLFLSALKRRETDTERMSIINEMSQSADALNGLFNSLLDVSRLDAEVIDLKPDHHVLDALFDRVRSSFIQQVESKGLELVMNASSSVVYADAILLERVLRNLLANAVQYTEQGRISLVSMADADGNYVISVSDTGVGIPMEARDEVFSEYYQLGNPERDRSKGLGLGLSIVQRICELTGMPLTMESTVGVGTSFRLVVPRGDSSLLRRPAMSAQALEVQPKLGDCLVMVIDDEQAVLRSMGRTLEDCGCSTLLASSARDALKQLALTNVQPQLILSDYRLRDDQNGIDAVAVVRESLEVDVPSVIITGDTSPDRLREIVGSGLHVLHKPVEQSELHALLERLIPDMQRSAA